MLEGYIPGTGIKLVSVGETIHPFKTQGLPQVIVETEPGKYNMWSVYTQQYYYADGFPSLEALSRSIATY